MASFSQSLIIRSRHNALDSIGVHFSAQEPLAERKAFTQLAPAFLNRDTAAHALSDSAQWRKVSFVYTATGTEVFLTIGSFKKAEHDFARPPDMMGNYYVYVDDVTLVALDDHERLCASADKVQMGRGRLRVYYHAYLHPVASNRTPEGRQRNRRVELFLYRHD